MFRDFEFQFTPHRVTGNNGLLPQMLSKTKRTSEILNIHVFQMPSVFEKCNGP